MRNAMLVGLCLVTVGATLGGCLRRTSAVPQYGPAGCGLGSLIWGRSSGQLFAMTTNGTSASQSFGLTTGTSNCTYWEPSLRATAAFVEANRPVLAKEVSRARGETIETLATVAGCPDAGAVGRKLQRDFAVIFSRADLSDRVVGERVVLALKRDRSLGCARLISTENLKI